MRRCVVRVRGAVQRALCRSVPLLVLRGVLLVLRGAVQRALYHSVPPLLVLRGVLLVLGGRYRGLCTALYHSWYSGGCSWYSGGRYRGLCTTLYHSWYSGDWFQLLPTDSPHSGAGTIRESVAGPIAGRAPWLRCAVRGASEWRGRVVVRAASPQTDLWRGRRLRRPHHVPRTQCPDWGDGWGVLRRAVIMIACVGEG